MKTHGERQAARRGRKLMKKVLLLSMPFGALDRPALGLSLLKARLAEGGIPCDVRYLTFPFAEFIGYDQYQWMMIDLPYTAFAGDWAFTHLLYGERPASDAAYVQEMLRQTWRLDADAIGRIQRIRSLTSHFLEYCLAAIPWEDYAVVGFTSTFEQNIASLALAQRIKSVHPSITIVFGGANWEAEMGCELHRQFPFVDYVCSGEAENSFPALVQRLLAGKPMDGPGGPIRGIVYRANGQSVSTGMAELIEDMDQLPLPDFSDYFRDLSQTTGATSVVPTLLFETSRGCWWGAKSHCTFCGLNGGTMAFRSKSAERAQAELECLVDRWQIEMIEAVDNILDMRYFNDFLPALARTKPSWQIFYEVKANLSRKQVQLLHEAGVHRIQPGIESLSDHVLKLMRKGTTALRNIQLLKWCKEYNVEVDWNILYGFPGETRQDYADTLTLLRAIRFLKPPTACGPVRLDRFSPYYNNPAGFGLKNVRPILPYKYLYPFDRRSLSRIAYYFDYDYEPGVDPAGYASEVIQYVDQWQREPETGALWSIQRSDGTLALIDTRSDGRRPQLVLAGPEQAAYEYCDEVRSGSSVAQHLRKLVPNAPITEQQVRRFLDSLVANNLMVTDGLHYLSLAIRMHPVAGRANQLPRLVGTQSALVSGQATATQL
jgi:ribosomal peptide maturation radical SAM protein 1